MEFVCVGTDTKEAGSKIGYKASLTASCHVMTSLNGVTNIKLHRILGECPKTASLLADWRRISVVCVWRAALGARRGGRDTQGWERQEDNQVRSR